MAVSSARRVVHDGHQPLLLQQNATIRDSAQASQVTSTKPNLGSPQVRKRSTSSLTRAGIERDTSGHPRRKASRNTDCSGARRRSSPPSSTLDVYRPPPTLFAPRLMGSGLSPSGLCLRLSSLLPDFSPPPLRLPSAGSSRFAGGTVRLVCFEAAGQRSAR